MEIAAAAETALGGPALLRRRTPYDARAEPRRSLRVTMLLENNPYPQDIRVRSEARSLAAAGHRVRVIAPRVDNQPARETIDGVSVERFRLPMIHSGSGARMALEYLVAHMQLYLRGLRALVRGTDVLHAHNPPDTFFPLALIGRLLGCRFVFDQHDLFAELVAEKYSSRTIASLARASQRLSVRAADLVITTNVSQRENLLSGTGRAGRNVIIVRNGLTRASLDRRREYRGGALRDPHLVYVGLLERQDGVDLLPAILAQLIEEHGLRDARLTVVGDGSRRRPVMEVMERRGLASHVHFTGAVPHDEALDLMAAADICLDVAPCSEFNHSVTMVKVIEYLTLGCPAVSFPLRETIRLAGDAIAYAERSDVESFARRVAELANSEHTRQQLAQRARRAAGELVWERSAETLIDGYRRLACAA